MLSALEKHWFLSVAQSRAEHHCVETAVPGSTDRPFQILGDSAYSASSHGEGCGSRGFDDAGACGADVSRGVLSGGRLHSDAAETRRLGPKNNLNHRNLSKS